MPSRSLVRHPEACPKDEVVTVSNLSGKPVTTRRRLEWDRYVEVEGEVRRRIDTFGEHEAAEPQRAFPGCRRHQDRDVVERALRLGSNASPAAT
jgi:hypothetical protein